MPNFSLQSQFIQGVLVFAISFLYLVEIIKHVFDIHVIFFFKYSFKPLNTELFFLFLC